MRTSGPYWPGSVVAIEYHSGAMSVKEYLVVDRLHWLSLRDRCNHVVPDAESSTESCWKT